MSCWVVPAIAAEFWGVTLDVVWNRIGSGLVPQKTESGFVFIDLYPWTPGASGMPLHTPPQTFVPADETPAHMPASWSSTQQEPEAPEQSCISEDIQGLLPDEAFLDDDEDPAEELDSPDDALPDLDEEEEATFGRLSWQEVRQQVSCQRRGPVKAD
jgi:hypothetical protein